jgi:hypothetical protein
MDKLENITTEVPNGFVEKKEEKIISIDEVISFFTENDAEKNSIILAGRVFQKNKKIKIVENLFKLLEEEIKKMESKNNKDLDNAFFNLNKKIISTNLYNIKEIMNQYNIDESRIIYFLLGTLIQYIYDKKD